MMTYSKKTIWITGASSGIGEALAYALSKQGAYLILSARRIEELERVKSKCQFPENIDIFELDIADYKNLELKVNSILKSKERLDLLINNAGVSQRAYTVDTSMDVYERIMGINVLGTIAMTKAVLPTMLNQGHGHISVITSLTGKFSTPLRTGYAASKHALHGFFDGLRAEIFRNNIPVSIICPGFVRTNIAVNALTGDGTKHNQRDAAINNGLAPDFVAHKIIKGLISEKEEIYIAGKEIAGVYLKRFLPGIFSRIINKVKVT